MADNVSLYTTPEAELSAVKAELERTRIERDYALRLLKQQQTLGAAHNVRRIRNEAFVFYMEKNSVVARLLSRVPRRLKNVIPVNVKQAVRDAIIKLG